MAVLFDARLAKAYTSAWFVDLYEEMKGMLGVPVNCNPAYPHALPPLNRASSFAASVPQASLIDTNIQTNLKQIGQKLFNTDSPVKMGMSVVFITMALFLKEPIVKSCIVVDKLVKALAMWGFCDLLNGTWDTVVKKQIEYSGYSYNIFKRKPQ